MVTSPRGQLNSTFLEEYLPQKKNVNQQNVVLPAANITKEEKVFIIFKTVMLPYVSMGVSRPTKQGKITDVM